MKLMLSVFLLVAVAFAQQRRVNTFGGFEAPADHSIVVSNGQIYTDNGRAVAIASENFGSGTKLVDWTWNAQTSSWSLGGVIKAFTSASPGFHLSGLTIVAGQAKTLSLFRRVGDAWVESTATLDIPSDLTSWIQVQEDSDTSATVAVLLGNSEIRTFTVTFTGAGSATVVAKQTITPLTDVTIPPEKNTPAAPAKVFPYLKMYKNTLVAAIEINKAVSGFRRTSDNSEREAYYIAVYDRSDSSATFTLSASFSQSKNRKADGSYFVISKPVWAISENTIAIGEEYAPCKPKKPVADCGAISLLKRTGPGATWNLVNTFIASDSKEDDEFGHRVDLTDTLLVTTMKAQDVDCLISDRCAVYVFDISNPKKPRQVNRMNLFELEDKVTRYGAVSVDRSGDYAVVSTLRGSMTILKSDANRSPSRRLLKSKQARVAAYEPLLSIEKCEYSAPMKGAAPGSPFCIKTVAAPTYHETGVVAITRLPKKGRLTLDLSANLQIDDAPVESDGSVDVIVVDNYEDYIAGRPPRVLAHIKENFGMPFRNATVAFSIGSKSSIGVMIRKSVGAARATDLTKLPLTVKAIYSKQ